MKTIICDEEFKRGEDVVFLDMLRGTIAKDDLEDPLPILFISEKSGVQIRFTRDGRRDPNHRICYLRRVKKADRYM